MFTRVRLSLCLLVAFFCAREMSLQGADGVSNLPAKPLVKKSTQVAPYHDPADMLFRRAPMAEASRSIVISLSTNLHLAFDTRLLRTHTVWSGESLNLYGPSYNGSANRFICDYTGTRLWGNRPLPTWEWSQGGVALENRYRGLSVKGGGCTLIYEAGPTGGVMVVHESPRMERVDGRNLVTRRLEIAATSRDATMLAHAEMGVIKKTSDPRAMLIQRPGDILLAVLRGPSTLAWRTQEADVKYELHLEAEKGGKGPFSEVITNQVAGHEAQLRVAIPAHNSELAFEIVTAVCRDRAEAERLIPAIERVNVKSPHMAFITNNEPDAGAPAPMVFQSGKSTAGFPTSDAYYRIEHFPLPPEIELRVGGMDWLPNGDLAVCTLPGEVYIMQHPQGRAAAVTYRRFARGLSDTDGLKVVNGQIYVAQKCELTRLVDTDGNGEADLFDNVNDSWGYNGNYHSFVMGPAVDEAGYFYVMVTGHRTAWEVPYMGWCVKVAPDGSRMEGFCDGLRCPNGYGTFGPDHDVFMTDNQGHWIPACKLNHLQQGKYYGHPSSKPAPIAQINGDANFEPPAIWFPYTWVRSASGMETINDERFGPFKGQMLVGEFQNSTVVRVALEKVDGAWQGAVFPFERGFGSGVNRLAMGSDGKLYVGGLKLGHWSGTVGTQKHSLDRVTFTGKTPFEVKEVHALKNGFELVFTQPVDAASAGNADSYDAMQYHYEYHGVYGAPESDKDEKIPSDTPVKVVKAEVSPDKLRVRLTLEGLKTGYVTMVRCFDVVDVNGKKLWHDTFHYTLNRVPR